MNSRQIALLVLITVSCGGCVSIGRRIDPETLAKVQVGVSTRAEVESLLGSPWTVSETPEGGVTLTYFYHQGWLIPPGRLLSMGLRAAKVPVAPSVLPKLWTGGSSEMEAVAVAIDSDDRVSNVSTFQMESERGDALFDRNRQSFGWTSRRDPDPNHTEALSAAASRLKAQMEAR